MYVGIIDSVKKYCYSQVIVIANIVMARFDCTRSADIRVAARTLAHHVLEIIHT